MRPGITFVLGGSKSGKSAYAERLASETASGRVLYIATANICDPEMSSRIAEHKARRPAEWGTWEGDVRSLPAEIKKLAPYWDTLLFDCLTMYVSDSLLSLPDNECEDEKLWRAAVGEILGGAREIFSGFREASAGTGKRFIAVSDEVGCGVIPPYKLGRRFRDLLGAANQIAAEAADEAALVVAGIPLWIKTRQ